MSRTRHSDLAAYYGARASEYDRVYERPERQRDLQFIKEILSNVLAERRVLELACGTGYWTQQVAQVAASVVALDLSEKLLKIAGVRLQRFSNAAVLMDDAMTLTSLAEAEAFDGGLAAFWWSHVARGKLPGFLRNFHSRLKAGSSVVFVDSRQLAGQVHPIARTDEEGNTYEHHTTSDGTEHEVLRNYPTAEELRGALKDHSRFLSIREFQFYWVACYQTC